MENYLYEKIIAGGFKWPDDIPLNADGFLIHMNNLISSIKETSKRDKIGNLVCKVFDELTVKYLKSGYYEAVLMNNQVLAQNYHNTLINVMNDPLVITRNKCHNAVITASLSKPKKRFPFAERLLNSGLLVDPVENNPLGVSKSSSQVGFPKESNFETTSVVHSKVSGASHSQSKQPLVSTRVQKRFCVQPTTMDKYANVNTNLEIDQQDFKLSIGNVKGKISKTQNTSNSKRHFIDKFTTSKSRYSKTIHENISQQPVKSKINVSDKSKSNFKINNDYRETSKHSQKVNYLDLDFGNVPKQKTFSKQYEEMSRQNKCSKISDINQVKYIHHKNSESFSTPVSHVSTLSKEVLNTIEINKRKKRKMDRDRSRAISRSVDRKRRADQTPRANDIVAVLNDSNNIDSGNNVSVEASAYTQFSTPTSSFIRRGCNAKVLYKRNLFSVSRKKNTTH